MAVAVSASVAVAFAVAVVHTTANNKDGLVCKKQDSGAGYGHITIPCWHLGILSTWEPAHGAVIHTALPVQHVCIHSSLSTTKIRPNIGCRLTSYVSIPTIFGKELEQG